MHIGYMTIDENISMKISMKIYILYIYFIFYDISG
jgi:hypothetical protein